MTLKQCNQLCHSGMHKSVVRREGVINCTDVAGGQEKAP